MNEAVVRGNRELPQAPAESLAGLIERVTFFNEESGFAVLKVKVQGRRDLVTLVGTLPCVNAGEWVVGEGRWVQDRDFGLQFRAELLRCSAPTSKEGIERYLGSGLVKGIGPVYAKRLVARFGEEVFDVIEHASARLETVEGIGPKRRERIKLAWDDQKSIRRIMVFLHSQGVGTSRAVRIFKTYGADAIERVQANPYGLARDIQGIGFKTADQMAQRLGVPQDSLLRAEAGVTHVLLMATEEGHCALPRELLKEQAIALLGVAPQIVEDALGRSLGRGDVVEERVGSETLVFLPHLLRAERGIAASIGALAALESVYPPIDVERALAWCEERTGKRLAPSQRAAVREALLRRVLIITGGPGVGKTTIVHAIIRILAAKKVRVQLCAPTGRAARRLEEATGLPAKTIHRLLEVKPGAMGFQRHEGHPLECDLLVADECSMVDAPLMQSLLRALPKRASLLLVGDVDQLPSVGPGMVLRDLVESGVVPVVRLTEVFRQAAHSHIILNAHRINAGLMPEMDLKAEGTDFFVIDREEPDAIVETLLEVVRERIPKRFGLDPVDDVQVLCPMNRGSLGIRELNGRLQEALNPRRTEGGAIERFGWRFAVGDKVIQLENDYEKDVFNGDIGRIADVDAEEAELVVAFDRRRVVYDFGELDELMPAFAITIHKSQGSEFPAVVIPVAAQHYVLLQRNLLYTAMTRGKRLVVLIGQRRAIGMAVRNNRVERRYSGLRERLRWLGA